MGKSHDEVPGHSLRPSVAQAGSSTPRRRKLKEKSDYNSSRRSFVHWFPTPRRWTLQGLQNSGKLHFRARRPIPRRQKLKEKGEYSSFLPNFRPSFVTAHCWMLEQLKKAR